MFLEVNYTFRHEDEDFMHKIQATELPDLIGPGLISLSYNLSPPEDASEDEQDPQTLQQDGGGGSKEGVMAFNKSLAPDPVSALTKEEISPQGLRALNLTLYTLTVADLKKVLEVQKHVMVLSVTLEVEPGEAWKKQLVEALEQCKGLEQVEVVANPTLQFFMEVSILSDRCAATELHPLAFASLSTLLLCRNDGLISHTLFSLSHADRISTRPGPKSSPRRHGQDVSIRSRHGKLVEDMHEDKCLQSEHTADH